MEADELIQVAERQLADAEEAYRHDPSDANQRRIMRAWAFVRKARGETERKHAVDEPPGQLDE